MKIEQEIINIREYNELLIKRGLEMMKKNATKGNNRTQTPLNARETKDSPLSDKYHSPKKKGAKKPLKQNDKTQPNKNSQNKQS